MRFRQARSFGAQANNAVGDFAANVDDRTGEVAQRAATVIALAVRVLRVPTAVVSWLPIPFIAMTFLLGLLSDGVVGAVILVIAVLMAAVGAAFWMRRARIIRAVEDPAQLATELGIMISLTDKVDETRGALAQIAGGGGWRLFARLRGVWKGATMTGRWIDGIQDLPRARYFGPPKIGTTITITIAALWLVPISIVVALFSLIGAIAGSL